MAFPGGPEAHDEAQAAVRNPGLVRVRHHGRIEQGHRFQGVLAGEQPTDDQLAGAGEGPVGEHLGRDPLEMGKQDRFQVEVAALEVTADDLRERLGLRLGQGQSPADDGGDPLGIGGNEGPENDPAALGRQDDVVPMQGERVHEAPIRAGTIPCSATLISARDSRKASVDSAPWFSLIWLS